MSQDFHSLFIKACCKNATNLSWAYLSPAAVIFPGEQTGQFRLGGDQLLMDAHGDSRISTGDYAVALLNEVQQPQQHNRRFGVAY